METDVENVLRACITVFALVLLVVSLVAYHRIRNKRILFTTAAFGAFFVKGVLLSWELANADVGAWLDGGLATFLDLFILVCLALTILKR